MSHNILVAYVPVSPSEGQEQGQVSVREPKRLADEKSELDLIRIIVVGSLGQQRQTERGSVFGVETTEYVLWTGRRGSVGGVHQSQDHLLLFRCHPLDARQHHTLYVPLCPRGG